MSSFNQRGCFGCGVYFVDGVLASGVEIILEMDFVRYAIQELEIHSFMIQIRILSMILQTFSTTLHNPSSSHTRVSYVGMILTMVLIVCHGFRFFDQPTQTSIDHQPPKEMSVRELLLQEKLHKALQAICEKLIQQEQTATESTIHLNEIISQIPPSIAITPVLPTMEPEDSLIMGDEDLRTILEKESDEFIKSSVKDLGV
ncbi:hypothetical protein Tco_0825426 [Tanacetum coccineum]